MVKKTQNNLVYSTESDNSKLSCEGSPLEDPYGSSSQTTSGKKA